MKIGKTHFRAFTLVCITLSVALNLNNAFGATINVPTAEYPTIQAGIDAAVEGDTVLIADGTYKGEGNKNLDFKGKAITVKSVNGATKTIIDCENDGRGFYFHSGETENSILLGITIRNGKSGFGGGIYCEGASPTITACTISENASTYSPGGGGGIYCKNSSARISNCTIIGNSSQRGGGIWCESSSLYITDCIIKENIATHANSGGIGITRSSPVIKNCDIILNKADMWGGGIGCFDSSPTIINTKIIGNNSQYWWGGGIVCYSSSPNLINCEINGNSAEMEGGGIYCNSSSPIITNCIITGNSAEQGGGVHSVYSSHPIIINSIFWGNSPDEISTLSADIDVTYSTVKGGWVGEGNIDLNPAFRNFSNGDYHLKNYSPCIGAGTNIGAPDTDIEGNFRPNPTYSNPDIGAYENSLATPLLNVFAMDAGNKWVYDSNIQRRITKIDQTTFPTDTYEMEILKNGVLIGKEWYETTNDQLLFWGTLSNSIFRFDKGLLTVWFPLSVGEQKKSSAAVVGYPGTTMDMTVDVLSFEKLALSLGTFDAYRLRYNFTTAGPGGTSTKIFDWWVVPYFGVVKQQTPGGEEGLISFAIHGGNITETSDNDNDDLLDYKELITYNTDPNDSDSDDDGFSDGDEVNIHGSDPNDRNSHPSRAIPCIPLLLLDD